MNRRNTILTYLALGSAAVLFLGLTVWLVRSEGRRTRESIREAAKEAGSEVRKGIVEGAERAVDKAGELPGKVLRDVKGELPSRVVEEAGQAAADAAKTAGELARGVKDTLIGPPESETEPAAEKAPPAGQAASELPPPSPAEAIDPTQETPAPPQPELAPPMTPQPEPAPPVAPQPTKPADAAAKTPTESGDPIKRLFNLGREVSKAVDEVGQEVFALSWEEEKKTGRDMHRALTRDYELTRPPVVVERLERLARPIANQRSRKELTLTFHVIESDEVNAFAHAGGYVYVTTGMLDVLKSDAQLQFFLAHEIAHHELKHTVQRITYAARASEVAGEAGGTLAQVAYMAIALGYSQEQELEADAWAFHAMLRAGRSREEALAGMRRMLTHVKGKERERKPVEARTPARKTLRQIEDHFRSHPPTAERLEALEALEVPARSGR